MHILVIGGGGREHALAWKIRQSSLCDNLFIAPGNPGTGELGMNLDLDTARSHDVIQAIIEHEIDMVIIGPEVPLVVGLADDIKNDSHTKDVMVIGPSKSGARLEGSKAYAKRFMEHFSIPTAGYVKFKATELDHAIEYIDLAETPIVLKADGLAAGKGVLICSDKAEAKAELKEMFSGKFGEASKNVVIEEFLTGREFSVFVITDGKSYKLLPVAKDYKRIGEGDTGLNTGGMGAVSPVPFVTASMMEKVRIRVIDPTLKGLQRGEIDYCGFIFFGLIDVDGDPYVIEYNCRLGDPETEVILPRIKSDLVKLMQSAADGTLADTTVEIDDQSCTTVMLVSGGYPAQYDKGYIIKGLDEIDQSILFHAGTKKSENNIVTNGGRVIAVTSLADDYKAALVKSYKAITHIHFDKQYFRRDIGFDLD
jgi:phosphoribosylamine--glycine ligase